MAFVLDITNQRNYVWILDNVSIYLVICKDDNGFAPNQSVKLKDKLNLTHDKTIDLPSYIKNSACFKGIIDESGVIGGLYDNDFTLIPGKLMLSSKITYGKTNKGLKKYQFRPCDNRFPKMKVASKLISNKDAYVTVEFDNNLNASLVEKICDVDDMEGYERVLMFKNIPRTRNKLFKKFRNYEYTSKEIHDEDWKKHRTFSIDPQRCKDVDDAISIKSGELAIHISTPTKLIDADLQGYVKKTITSFYGKTDAIHLLPDKLIECASLNEKTEKYVLSVVFSKAKNTRLVRSIIKVDKNYTYENVLNTSDFVKLVKAYEDIFGEVVEDSHEIVEKLMVHANSYVAEYLVGKLNGDALIRKTFDDGSVNYYHYHEGESNNHSGLNVELYTHFTSPLRRFADQIVHRALFNIFEEKPKNTLELEDILKLNQSKLKEKLLYSKLDVIDLIRKENISLKGRLLYICDGYARIESDNLRASIPIASRKIDDLIQIYKSDDTYEILIEDHSFFLNIDDEVYINISYDKLRGMEGISYEWISPNFCLI
jgi:hypothetical protein